MQDNEQCDFNKVLLDAKDILHQTTGEYRQRLDKLTKQHFTKPWNAIDIIDMWKLFTGFWMNTKNIAGSNWDPYEFLVDFQTRRNRRPVSVGNTSDG